MKSTNPYSIHPKHLQNAKALRRAKTSDAAGTPTPPPTAATIRTTGREYVNPVDYKHPFDSMARFAQALALGYDANRTRHAYYRQVRLIHEHFACDPALLTESQLRDYFVFIKLEKHWKPKTIRQALAATRMFFLDLLGHSDWTVFFQIRTKDHDTLPAVLTRKQVRDLLAHIRLRRYRTPIKLIYGCGLRLSECLALTIHDIKGAENKLFIRNSKGHHYAKVVVMDRCRFTDFAGAVFGIELGRSWSRRKFGEICGKTADFRFRDSREALYECIGPPTDGSQSSRHNSHPLRIGFAFPRLHR